MQYNSNDMDNKLRQLETQSIPDMSKMDEHWQQMKTALHPEVAPRPASFILKHPGRWIFAGCLIIGLFFLAYKLITPISPKKINDKTVSVIVSPVEHLNDSTPRPAIKSDKQIIIYHKYIAQPAESRAKYEVNINTRDTIVAKILTNDETSIAAFNNNIIIIEDFFRDLEKPSQTFVIDAKRDTILRGMEGTTLFIPANSFTETGPVTIHLSEFYNYHDMITNRLSTTCNGNLLVTGGMLNIEAFSGNKKITKSRDAITVEMPAKIVNDSMQLFLPAQTLSELQTVSPSRSSTSLDTVEATATTTGLINWLPAGGNQSSVNQSWLKFRKTNSPVISSTILTSDSVIILNSIREVNSTSIATLENKYNFRITDLGWMNCDMFYNYSRLKTNFTVELPGSITDCQAFLVFDKMKSIMQGKLSNDTIIFAKLPDGETAKLIVVAVRNNKPVMTLQSVQITSVLFRNIQFEETTSSEFKKRAATLDQ